MNEGNEETEGNEGTTGGYVLEGGKVRHCVTSDLLAALREHRKGLTDATLATEPDPPSLGDASGSVRARHQTADRLAGTGLAAASVLPPPPVTKVAAVGPTEPTPEPELPAPPDIAAVEAFPGGGVELVEKVPTHYREIGARLCDDSRRIGTVEHAPMVQPRVAVRLSTDPVTARAVITVPDLDRSAPPDPEYDALLAEAHALAAGGSPAWRRALVKEAVWHDTGSLRKFVRGLREMAALRHST